MGFGGHFPSRNPGDGFQDLTNRRPDSGPEIDCDVLRRRPRRWSKCEHVSLRQVGDMDIVAHTGAVGGFVVVSEDGQMGDLISGRLPRGSRYQMGFRIVPFTKLAVGIGAAGVEIAQSDVAQP